MAASTQLYGRINKMGNILYPVYKIGVNMNRRNVFLYDMFEGMKKVMAKLTDKFSP